MNDLLLNALKLIVLDQKYDMIININTYFDLLKYGFEAVKEIGFQPITEKNVLMTGLYGQFFECNCFVSKNIKTGYIRVANKRMSSENDSGWSIEIPLAEYKKYSKLKSFW